MYERLSDLLEGLHYEDEPARDVLKALREPTAEVLAAGISAAAWRAAIDAMLAKADEVDAAKEAEAAAERLEDWPQMVEAFEKAGCQVTRSATDEHAWLVLGPGVELTVNVRTAEVDGLNEGPYDYPFGELTQIVPNDVAYTTHRLAQKQRWAKLRETHRWDRAAKAWLPKTGIGPVIPGGGSA